MKAKIQNIVEIDILLKGEANNLNIYDIVYDEFTGSKVFRHNTYISYYTC